MSETPFMPKATAVWLVENTTLTFKQIANFCSLHELEVKGIADGDVAKGIKAYNPILAGQLSRDEIDACSKDPEKNIKATKFEKISFNDVLKKGIKVMDSTAFTLSQENNLPIIVFDMNKKGNLLKLISGEKIGTTVNL